MPERGAIAIIGITSSDSVGIWEGLSEGHSNGH